MAQPVTTPDPAPEPGEPSFDALRWHDEPWTARLALDLLPETNGPRIEVLSGSVIVTPHAGTDHQAVERELPYVLHRAARRAGYWVYPEINVVSGSDLFIPDIAVLRAPGGGRSSVKITEAVLLAEVVSAGTRRKDVIDRPRQYAAAGVPFFLRVDLRNRVPAIALFELVEGEYRPVAAAAAGNTFVMREPFEFSIDPAELLDDEPAEADLRDDEPAEAGTAEIETTESVATEDAADPVN
ncbi:Uma2 family endonuclease [Plantactinospora sp. GCM10030261]|uniref:Uma2 family endonuclease n=1 Tax=Plantactinospora sp. GCM10030261 TaxID=3273420 RepID=UPI00360DBE19